MKGKKISFIGWAIVLGFIYAITKTNKFGYNLVYYSLVLILILLLVGQYKSINDVMTTEINDKE